MVVSLALYLYSRKDLREPRFILDLGLMYMVYTAAALGVMMHWGPVSDEPVHIFPMITWIGAGHINVCGNCSELSDQDIDRQL